MVQIQKMNKILYVSTNGACNNFCLGCGAPPSTKERPEKNILEDMRKGRLSGYENLHLIGGELTIQDNIFDILEPARRMFRNVFLTTNGRMFRYQDFARKISPLVDAVTVSLYGNTAATHESWTRVRGSFEQTICGIKNLVRLKKNNLCVNHLIWKGNYRIIAGLLKLDTSLGVKKIGLLNLEPTGRAKSIYKKLCVPLSELDNFDLGFNGLLERFESVEAEDFPRCIFSPKILSRSNFHIQDIGGQLYLDNQKQINTYGIFSVRDLGFNVDSNSRVYKRLPEVARRLRRYRIKLKACSGCPFLGSCAGLFREYVKVIGPERAENEIARLRKKYA